MSNAEKRRHGDAHAWRVVRVGLIVAAISIADGDQRHTYRNLDLRRSAVAVTVVCFAPAGH